MIGRRIRDWLVGRHEFRCLVEVDPALGAAHGGRPVPGAACMEFVQSGTGTRGSARLEALTALRDRLAAELPGATVLAVLDGGRPAQPEPRLHLMKGGRPRLLLVGGDDEHAVQQHLDRVVHLWGLQGSRYSPHGVVDRAERRRRILGVTRAVPFGFPILGLLWYLAFGGIGDDRPFLARLADNGDPRLPAALLALALLPGLAVAAWSRWHRSWPTKASWMAAASPLVLVASVLIPAGVLDGVQWLNRHVPFSGPVVIGALVIAGVPVLMTYIEAPAWRAALGWGLPLLAGGISLFVGELLLELYLSGFGITRSDVQVPFWGQWLTGAVATVLCMSGVYIGVALWAVFRRLGRVSLYGVIMAVLIAVIYLLTVVQGVLLFVEQRAQVTADGVPSPLPGLWPRLACIEETGGPYSYVGQPVDPASEPVVYFGRADGRLAVWSARSGGVLLDGQAVGLRFVEPGSTCS
jgi:hypothetical protein